MTTRVIFRKFPEENYGDQIALFPDEEADFAGNILSYQHIGQHGAASPLLISELDPCTPEEYADLLDELVSIGYDNLEIEAEGIYASEE